MSILLALSSLMPLAGAQEVCDGTDNDGDGLVDALPATRGPDVSLTIDDLLVAGDTWDQAGQAQATLSTPDGHRVAIGQPSRSTPGEVRVEDGDGTVATLVGVGDGDYTGAALARAGDHDEDGYEELLVAAPWATGYHHDFGTFEGVVHLVDGAVSGEHQLGDESRASILGSGTDTGFGWSIAGGGDLNGDGAPDVAIGAWTADAGVLPEGGVVAIFYGPLEGTYSFDEADAFLLGEDAADGAGFSVAFAGDVDGDGADELIVGAPSADGGDVDGGAAYLVSGDLSGEVSLADATARLLGENEGSAAGWAVSPAGDVDGDGYADVLVGAPHTWDARRGRAYLLYGPFSGDVDLAAADVMLQATGFLRGFGATLATLGDLDGDGADEFAIGSAWAGRATTSLFQTPESPLVRSSDAWRTFLQPEGRGGVTSVTGADLSGDGTNDVVVGLPGHGGWDGASFVVDGEDIVDTDLRVTLYADADGDGYADVTTGELVCEGASGYVPAPTDDAWDCDDTEASVHPAGLEVCDELDNDCDGETDEEASDAISWAWDLDGDGYAGLGETMSCDAPSGTVEPGGEQDCDDQDADRHPGADELCNTIDDDCDGAVDDDPVDLGSWYADADGDGHGAGDATLACEAPSGAVDSDDDCDDGDAAVSPSASETCNAIDDDCDGEADDGLVSDWYADLDGDGYGDADSVTAACVQPERTVANASDCDDSAADVSPAGTETCDGRDEDCDGTADDGLTGTWYADLDGDGYGDPSSATTTCEDPGALVEDSSDCDDTAADVNPDGTETCDGRDEDCDGTADDEVGTTWYVDADGDGFGGDETVVACEQPSGTTATATDCDDRSADVNPRGEETCDGVDQDCDGATDEGATLTWYTDADGDGFGDASAPVASCEGGDGLVEDATDCDDRAADVSPAGTETCDERDEDCDGETDEDAGPSWYADADGDGSGAGSAVQACDAPSGHVADSSDCDDADATVSPGGTEVCDGIDNDCDGTIDDDAHDLVLGYADEDGDGHGGYVTAWACAYGDGVEELSTDCDDGDAATHPDADELCDDTDNDCDGATDEDAVDRETWYADADGDGYGDADSASLACNAPSGSVADASDCDDTSATVHPGATEDCDGVDENCDGEIDEGLELQTWYVDADGDGFGGDETVESCLQPSGTTTEATDCDDTSSAVKPGAEEVCDDLDNDCDGLIDVTPRELEAVMSLSLAETSFVGELGGADVGHTVVPVGDLDGDGDDDVVVAAPGAERGGGAVYVFYGPVDGELTLDDADAALLGVDEVDSAGYAVAAADVDGDGYAELAIGAPSRRFDDGSGWREGVVYVVNGPLYGTIDLAGASAMHVAAGDGDAAGAALAFADTDADGQIELLVGAPTASGSGAADGAVYLVDSPLVDSQLEDATLVIAGPGDAARFGAAVAAGDLDGDGDDELAVGAWADGSDEAGAVYVFDASSGTLDTGDASGALLGLGDDLAGAALANVGDLDGDGGDELLVGGPGRDDAAGVVWQVSGVPAGDTSLDLFPAITGAPASQLGMALANGGDFDGNGTTDLVLGAPNRTSSDASASAGAIHLFLDGLGSATTVDEADLTLEGLAASHAAGGAVAFLGDLDGDGADDLGVGAVGDDIGGTLSVVFGDLTRDYSMAPNWYADADGDGWGVRDLTEQTCDQPSGYVADAGDCDDADASISPSAHEICDELDNDCDAWLDEDDAIDAPTWHVDEDGDGFAGPDTVQACVVPYGGDSENTDCDDGDATRHPDADEVCNGLDDDCDDEVDTDAVAGLSSWYADTDGDGYGDPDALAEACSEPSGYLDDASDCDDTDVDVNPDGTERCDGIDNDCDGDVDGETAVDRGTWHTDADGDGYGDDASSVRACDMPSGMMGVGGDCDDADTAISPAADELCDGIDNNCDTVVDDETSLDAATWYADSDEDGYGDPESSTVACDQPVGKVSDDSDCNDLSADAYPGATELCDNLDNDCDGTADEDAPGTSIWYLDADGDYRGDPDVSTWSCEQPEGYRPHGDDCDDTNADISPVEVESCDGLDNDCDGEVDDGVGDDWYADADGDGYGNKNDTVVSCDAPTGYGSNKSDCDDTDASVHPNADEYCDAIDQDCDGEVDDGHSLDATEWFWDKDGDGYGRSSTSTQACTQPDDYVADNTDCVDWNADSYPGGVEICDEEDNDCDDLTDEGVDDAPTWYLDADEDGYGTDDTTVTQCSAPNGYVADGGDCEDGDEQAYPGAIDWCGDGIDGDCDGTEPSPCSLDSLSVIEAAPIGLMGTAADENLGEAIANAGDLDGDGDDELLVTAPYFIRDVSGTDWECGAAYQVSDPGVGEQLVDSVSNKAYGEERFLRMGEQVAALGDLDGDGELDWAVGAMRDNTVGSKSGAVYLYDGQLTGDSSVSNAVWLLGESGGDQAGSSLVGPGDVNGDGFHDVLVGAWKSNANGSDSGSVYLLHGPVDNNTSLENADAQIVGSSRDSYVGETAAGPGDVDGDGYADILVGGPQAGDGGEVHLLLGPISGEVDVADADVSWSGEDGAQLGTALAAAGDIDGDGQPDLLMSADRTDDEVLDGGSVYVATGLSGDLASDAWLTINGTTRQGYLGDAVHAAGDLDGSGSDDLVVSASSWSEDTGSVFVFLDPTTGTLTTDEADGQHIGSALGDRGGAAIGSADTDGDGRPELLIGSPGFDGTAENAGGAWALTLEGL